ncbi:hypothetical protein [Parasitella parasitica]|uniref:Uncharacterized protein n=1 Tax=Parasitella parasitica TaxID=35722 RepID=A0A0B7MTX8_9FUNG|nr:hypothetical protein [Parasitella parasitica]
MSESGLRSHLLKKCALTCKVFEYGELHGVYLNGQQIHVGTITFLFFERQQFGWPQGVMPGTVPKNGVFVPLLFALSKTGKHLKATVLTPSRYDKKQEVTESELGQFLEFLSADESDVLGFGGLELTPIDSTERSLFGYFLLRIKDSLRRNKLDKENMLIPRLVEAMKKSAEDARKTHVNEGEKCLEDSRVKQQQDHQQQQTGPHTTEMVLLTKERTALKEEKLILLEEKNIIAGIKKKLLEDERIFREDKKKFLEEKQQFEKLQGKK